MPASVNQARIFLNSMMGASRTAGRQAMKGLAGSRMAQAIVLPAAGAMIGATGNALQGKDPWRGAAAGALVGGGAFAFRYGYAQRVARSAWGRLPGSARERALNTRNAFSNRIKSVRFSDRARMGIGAGIIGGSLAYGANSLRSDYRRAESQGRNGFGGIMRAAPGHYMMQGGLIGAGLYAAGRLGR